MIICEVTEQNSNISVPELGGTPSSNTGLNSQKVPVQNSSQIQMGIRIDWLQGTFKPFSELKLKGIIKIYERVAKDKVDLKPGQGHFKGVQWASSASSPLGFRAWWNLPGENGAERGHGMVSLPGSCLGRLTAGEIRKLAQELKALGFSVTRLDIALDDYTKSISFSQVRSAIAKKFRVHFEESEVLENYGKWGGFTIGMGSKHSDIRLIFYNKAAESRGVIDSYRWEARFRNDRAKAAFGDWLSAPEELEATVLSGLVLGVVNFVKRDGKEKNISRLPELRWWKRFKQAVGACIRHSFQKLPTTLKRCKAWIQDDVIRNLALICEVIGHKRFVNWLVKELKCAPQGYNDQHLIRREVWKREWEEIVEVSALAV